MPPRKIYFLQLLGQKEMDKETKKIVRELSKAVASSISKGRALLQDIEPIREPKTSLISAIKKAIKVMFDETPTEVEFSHTKKLPTFNPLLETKILRIVQEALMNIRKHAQATKAKMKISYRQGILNLTIKDNGAGFNLKQAAQKATEHYGLLFMQERAFLAKGKIEVQSKPGKGTTLRASFNLEVAKKASK